MKAFSHRSSLRSSLSAVISARSPKNLPLSPLFLPVVYFSAHASASSSNTAEVSSKQREEEREGGREGSREISDLNQENENSEVKGTRRDSALVGSDSIGGELRSFISHSEVYSGGESGERDQERYERISRGEEEIKEGRGHGNYASFGFRSVEESLKPSLVSQVFSNVASKYDIMNDVMSGGLHRLWKDRFVSEADPKLGTVHLDVAGGTGDIAFRIYRQLERKLRLERRSHGAERARERRGREAGGVEGLLETLSSLPLPIPLPFSALSRLALSSRKRQYYSDDAERRREGERGGPSAREREIKDEGQESEATKWREEEDEQGEEKRVMRSRVIVCDFNEEMLRVGRQRAERMGIPCYEMTESANSHSPSVTPALSSALPISLEWLQGDAQSLPATLLPDSSVHSYSIAFGIRNVTRVQDALEEAYRVLKPGGRFLCLELSHIPNRDLQTLYDLYSFTLIPLMGKIIANDRESYQYLVESIRKFPNQHKFALMMQQAGFRNVSYENFTSGIVAMHSGYKEREEDQ